MSDASIDHDRTAPSSLIAAFGEDHVSRLTGVSKHQLRYWDRSGFYRPRFAAPDRRQAYSRVYSFSDIVSLRVLNALRNQFGVPLQHLRDVSERLSHLPGDRWRGVRLWVVGKRVVWQEPDTGMPQEVASGQYLVPVELSEVVARTETDIDMLNTRNDEQFGQISKSRYVNHNAAVLAGTRIPVDAIRRFDAAGYNAQQIIAEYPDLTADDIAAALAYEPERNAA